MTSGHASSRHIGLFVQIFAGIWLALLLMSLGSWAVFESYQEQKSARPWIDSKPLGQKSVASAVGVAQFAGRDALIAWLKDPEANSIAVAYAVNDENQEISGRPLPPGIQASLTNPAYAPAIASVWLNGEHLRIFALRPNIPYPKSLFFTFGRQPLWLQLLLALFATSAVAAMLAWYYTIPIRKLHRAMQKTAQGDFVLNMRTAVGHQHDELGELASQYDEMAAKIANLIARQKRLFHDVSHELRSPLARMEIAVGLADKEPTRTAEMLKRIEHEIEVLDGLVDELLTYARLDEAATISFESADLMPILETIADNARFEGSNKHINIDLVGPDHLYACINAEALGRSIENLVRNALRFSPEQGKISLIVRKNSESIRITVMDQGPGMDDHLLSNVFLPFYRGPGEKTGTGFGLGLAIAKKAIERHGGTLTASNHAPHGLCMTITLPVDHTMDGLKAQSPLHE